MLLAAFTWTEKESITDLYHSAFQKQSHVPCSCFLLLKSGLNILTEHTRFGKQIPGAGNKSRQSSDCFNLRIAIFEAVMDTIPLRPSQVNSTAIDTDSYPQIWH